MMFRIVFWDVLPCKMIVNNHFTQQYIPQDNSEHQKEGNEWKIQNDQELRNTYKQLEIIAEIRSKRKT
jgi:hypothetical protein